MKKEHFTTPQIRQIRHQMSVHGHKRRLEVSLALVPGIYELRRFVVFPGVLRPDISDSQQLARYLYFNNLRLYFGKSVVDMGCGSGILGIVTGMQGAKKVVCIDVSGAAVANADENIHRFNCTANTTAMRSDLFEDYTGKADLIVFSHPFFCGSNEGTDSVYSSMVAPESLLVKFLDTAKMHLAVGGTILMPYFDFAGKKNNPHARGTQMGFDVQETFRISGDLGAVKGALSIFELRIEGRRAN